MLIINYFASIRESLNQSQQRLELPLDVTTVSELINHLVQSDKHLADVLGDDRKVLVAVNQTIVDRAHVLSNNDEIAFFPPMTGG